VENNNLRNNVAERRAKKKKKWVVLFTELVLTAEWVRAIVAAKEAEEEAKGQAKAIREALKTAQQEVATIAKAQVEKRKKACSTTAEAKKLLNQH
jgi:Tfp pilus assembly protein PilO